MSKYEIKIDNELEIFTEEEALELLKKTVEGQIESEREYLNDEELQTSDTLEELLEIDKNWVHELQDRSELLFGHNNVNIIEFDSYLTDVLKENGYSYDKSTMSKSIYVENKEGKLIRISDHNIPNFSLDYGYRIPDINLIYKDRIINNSDINRYFNTNLEYERVLL